MGYSVNVTGEIDITPPIPWGQIKDSPFRPEEARKAQKDVKFRIESSERETDEGTLTVRSATALMPTWVEDARARHLVEHVQAVIDTHPGHEFTGRLYCAGERPGDLWRVEVHDRRAVRLDARIVWPDGSEGFDQ